MKKEFRKEKRRSSWQCRGGEGGVGHVDGVKARGWGWCWLIWIG